MNESSCYSTSSLAFDIFCVLDFGHPNRCVAVSCFNLQFHNDICGVFFHMLICHLYIFLGEVAIQVFCPFFKLGFFFFSNYWVLRVHCVFWLTVFYQMCLLQIFFPSLWLVFSLSWPTSFSLTSWWQQLACIVRWTASPLGFAHVLGTLLFSWLHEQFCVWVLIRSTGFGMCYPGFNLVLLSMRCA